MTKFDLHCGDSLEVMRTLDADSVDAIVTDPPYGLEFMGKEWDGADGFRRSLNKADAGRANVFGRASRTSPEYQAGPLFQEWCEAWAREALRVLKPGGHLLAFSGSRTYHRMTCAIEDAGFEVRDQIMWIYGSGFPKSRNLDGDWQGWGTALKPAHEPICVARKPLVGTVSANVLEFGTGALNIDACRVQGEPMRPNTGSGGLPPRREDESRGPGIVAQPHELGRWPSNVIHDGSDEVIGAFPDAPGQMAKVTGCEPTGNGFSGAVMYGGFIGRRESMDPRADSSKSAARFFYCAKASRADRNEGCDALPDVAGGMTSNTSGQHITRRGDWEPEPVKNNHPTVKPTSLMAYLCRLVTPPGGTVLDPFMGSGSTGKACMHEGFAFIGIDLSPEYVEIARARIAHAARSPRQVSLFEVVA